MDIELQLLKTLKNNNKFEELYSEYEETINCKDEEIQKRLANILMKVDKLSIEQIKEIFMSEIKTSRKYKHIRLFKWYK